MKWSTGEKWKEVGKMEKSISFFGRQIDSNQITYGCPPNLYVESFPLAKKYWKETLRRVFHWQGNKEKNCYSLVKWHEVRLSKTQGGLDIKNLSIQNTNLLQKWLWRFCCEDMALWRRFISKKYGLQNSWCSESLKMCLAPLVALYGKPSQDCGLPSMQRWPLELGMAWRSVSGMRSG